MLGSAFTEPDLRLRWPKDAARVEEEEEEVETVGFEEARSKTFWRPDGTETFWNSGEFKKGSSASLSSSSASSKKT